MVVLKIDKSIQLIIAGLGVAQSFYLSLYSFFDGKRNFKNVLLGTFFFSITLRIVKSIFWVYLETTPDWFLNLGFVAHSAFGPLLFLYIYYYVFDRKWAMLSLLHFIPSIALLVFIMDLTVENFWYLGGYTALLYHQLIYGIGSAILLGVGLYKKKEFTLKGKDWLWLGILVLGTLLLQLSYFFNYVLGLTPYLLGPMVYGIFIYFSSFFLIKNPELLQHLKTFKKYENINVSETGLKKNTEVIALLMATEKPFLSSDFSIKQLAERTNLPRYLVSYVINTSFSKNFSDYINTHRIEEAKLKLMNHSYYNLKISSIAFDCGFNSLSSFNSAFKKHVGLTPSQFKKRYTDL